MPQRPDERRPARPSDPESQPDNRVDEASEESFPASDPPSFTPERSGGPVDQPDAGRDTDRPGDDRRG